MGNGNSNSSGSDTCRSDALNTLARDSMNTTLTCAPSGFSQRSGHTPCHEQGYAADQLNYSANLEQCNIDRINRNISAKGGVSAGDGYSITGFNNSHKHDPTRLVPNTSEYINRMQSIPGTPEYREFHGRDRPARKCRNE